MERYDRGLENHDWHGVIVQGFNISSVFRTGTKDHQFCYVLCSKQPKHYIYSVLIDNQDVYKQKEGALQTVHYQAKTLPKFFLSTKVHVD